MPQKGIYPYKRRIHIKRSYARILLSTEAIQQLGGESDWFTNGTSNTRRKWYKKDYYKPLFSSFT